MKVWATEIPLHALHKRNILLHITLMYYNRYETKTIWNHETETFLSTFNHHNNIPCLLLRRKTASWNHHPPIDLSKRFFLYNKMLFSPSCCFIIRTPDSHTFLYFTKHSTTFACPSSSIISLECSILRSQNLRTSCSELCSHKSSFPGPSD